VPSSSRLYSVFLHLQHRVFIEEVYPPFPKPDQSFAVEVPCEVNPYFVQPAVPSSRNEEGDSPINEESHNVLGEKPPVKNEYLALDADLSERVIIVMSLIEPGSALTIVGRPLSTE